MKKRLFIIAVLIMMLLVFTGCGGEDLTGPETDSQNQTEAQADPDMELLNETGRTQYTADMSISRPDTMEDFVYLTGTQSVTFRNDSEDTWNEIVMRDFSPSILKDEVFTENREGRDRPYDAKDPQHTGIESASQGGEALEIKEDEDPSIVRIKLKEPLEPGGSAKVDLTLKIKVASGSARQGFEQVDAINKDDPKDSGEITVSLNPALPMLSKYADGEWICHKYFVDGECSFTDCADFHVTAKVPEGFKLAASGKETLNDDGSYTVEAIDMRDFSLVAGDTLNCLEDQSEGVAIRVWYYDNGNDVYHKAAERALKIAKDAVSTFTDYYGKCAYDELDITFTPFHHAGMESPGILRIDDLECLISNEADESGEGDEQYRSFRTNIVHEIAHEWFYSAVGNDCFEEPWLDEGFARFSELIFMEKHGLKDSASDFLTGCRENYNGAESAPINISSGECIIDTDDTDGYIYGWTIYDGSALFLYDLRDAMGEEAFASFVRSWYTENMNTIVTTEQFLDGLYKADDSEAVHKVIKKYMRVTEQ